MEVGSFGGYLAQLGIVIAVCILLWTVCASPLLLGHYLAIRRMRAKNNRSPVLVTALALVFALLAAPVPTPILTVFLPHAFALADQSYYESILHGPALFSQLLPWIVVSLPTTFAVAVVVSWRYVRRP